MDTITNDRTDQGYQGGNNRMNHAYDMGWGTQPYTLYEDPAITNPRELATFPKRVRTDVFQHSEHNLHHITLRTPLREGRNITRTDNHPEKNGFI